MANFLETFKACIESFFTSKKAWIGSQAYPKQNNWIEIPKQSPGNYVAPSDGYILFFISGTGTADIQGRSSYNEPYSRYALSVGAGFNASSTIQLRKGDTASYDFHGGTATIFRFIPTEGA